jgi:hypothetical protein
MGTIQNMATIVLTLILPANGGYPMHDCVHKAKRQLGINRALTEDEKTQFAGLIMTRYPGMELSNVMQSINIGDALTDYSTGGGVPPGSDIPDVVLSIDESSNIGGIIFAGAGILVLWGLLKW